MISCNNISNLEKGAKYADAELIESNFSYSSSINLENLKDFTSFKNDTLKIYDYWALVNQPEYKAEIFNSNDTIHIKYLENSILVKTWCPLVETYIKIYLKTNYNNITLHFSPVRYGREIYEFEEIDKKRFRNASKEYYYNLYMKRKVTIK